MSGKAKAYQVKQIRDIIFKYDIRLKEKKYEVKAKYEMIIYWSKEDQAYIVEVPELPSCMADGKSYQEAVGNAEVIIQEWIDTAKELGRPIPRPKGKLMYA